VGYAHAADYTCDNILLNFDPNDAFMVPSPCAVHMAANTCLLTRTMQGVARGALAMSMLCTFPLLLLPCRNSLNRLIHLCKKKTKPRSGRRDSVTAADQSPPVATTKLLGASTAKFSAGGSMVVNEAKVWDDLARAVTPPASPTLSPALLPAKILDDIEPCEGTELKEGTDDVGSDASIVFVYEEPQPNEYRLVDTHKRKGQETADDSPEPSMLMHVVSTCGLIGTSLVIAVSLQAGSCILLCSM